MNCNKFQDSISDYVEGELDSRAKAECATHRLVCRDCRELYNDVRATITALTSLAGATMAEPEGLENTILAATSTGEMLSCNEFDRLLERYFDGVILAPTFQNFQSHFEKCSTCRRLFAGIEDAIAMCRDAKEVEVEIPASLNDRIVEATIGKHHQGLFARLQSAFANFSQLLLTPQLAVAALIFAASSLLIISRFGSVEGMASHAEDKARRIVNEGQQRITETGAKARVGFQSVSYEVNSLLFDEERDSPKLTKPTSSQSGRVEATPTPQNPAPTPQTQQLPRAQPKHRK